MTVQQILTIVSNEFDWSNHEPDWDWCGRNRQEAIGQFHHDGDETSFTVNYHLKRDVSPATRTDPESYSDRWVTCEVEDFTITDEDGNPIHLDPELVDQVESGIAATRPSEF